MMKLPPIALFSSKSEIEYDDAGTQVIKSKTLPSSLPSYSNLPKPFHPRASLSSDGKVPSLVFYCLLVYINRLSSSERGAFLNELPPPRPYGASFADEEIEGGSGDLLQLLIPHMHPHSRAVNWRYVDPRLWITLIRLFWTETLPETFLHFELPLADAHLPYMQLLVPSDHFTLITVLNLSGKPEVTDESIIALKSLHLLAVLDVSATSLTAKGVKKLADALIADESLDFLHGPWRLRILSLRSCSQVDSAVDISLAVFPLLSVIDLRGTKCSSLTSIVGWTTLLPQKEHTDLFYPAPVADMITSLGALATSHSSRLFESAQPPFSIYINRLYHPRPDKQILEFRQSSDPQRTTFPAENGYVVLGPDGRIGQGDSVTLEKKRNKVNKLEYKLKRLNESGKLPDNSYIRDESINELQSAKQSLRGDCYPPFYEDSVAPPTLHEAQVDAYQRLVASNKDKANAKAKRLEREAIEYSRDPAYLSADEQLYRRMVLIRVPPDWSELEKAAEKRIGLQKRFMAIKEAQKESSSIPVMKATAQSIRTGEQFLEVARSNKKRKADGIEMWNEIIGGSIPTRMKKSEVVVDIGFDIKASQATTSSRNPFSRKPSVDPKKVVRSFKS